MTNFFIFFSKFIIINRFMEKLPQFQSTCNNNTEAKNDTFERNNEPWISNVVINIPISIKFTKKLLIPKYIKLKS